MHDLDRTLRSHEPETENDFEQALFGESEGDFEGETSALSEEEEISLAEEMLAITDDRELDQFLGGVLKRARGALGGALKKYLKPLAKKLIPIAATAVGGYFGGPIGAKLGGKLGSFATNLFEADFESMDGEAQDMEVARSFVRFADAAATSAAKAAPSADPSIAARTAITQAAKTHAPGLLRPRGGSAGGGGNVVARNPSNTGRWIRRQGRIVLLGV